MKTNGLTTHVNNPTDIVINPARCRINMLTGEAFRVAFLAEFGFTMKTIAEQTGLSIGQVEYRLARSGVRTSDYRNGRGVIAQMVIRGTAKAGVPQLRAFTEDLLRKQLRQIGWKDNAITPEF